MTLLVTGWVALEIARSTTKQERERIEGPKKTAEAHH